MTPRLRGLRSASPILFQGAMPAARQSRLRGISRNGILFCAAMLSAASALAQMSPLGLWRNVDDKTGEAKAEIRIAEHGGALSGHIEKSLKKDGKPTCEECTDDRKGQPIVGLEIIRGGRKAEGEAVWEGGKILDPENGKEYRASYTPIDGGRKLEVRGYLGPFWRTQTWVRLQ